jgi:hypothetical protein
MWCVLYGFQTAGGGMEQTMPRSVEKRSNFMGFICPRKKQAAKCASQLIAAIAYADQCSEQSLGINQGWWGEISICLPSLIIKCHDLEMVFPGFSSYKAPVRLRQTSWAFQHFPATDLTPSSGWPGFAGFVAGQHPFMTPWSKWPRSTSKSWPKKRTGRCTGSGRWVGCDVEFSMMLIWCSISMILYDQ